MRCLAVLLASVLFATSASAGLDPETKVPYKLTVVLRFGQDTIFSPTFRADFTSDLKNLLVGSFGNLAVVELVELSDTDLAKAPPLWKAAVADLTKLPTTGPLTGIKTHFLFLDRLNNEFILRSRQHDGVLNMAAPAVRTVRTAERRVLTRLALGLLERDFGMIGTVNAEELRGTVEVAFRASDLGVTLDRWVKPKDIFAVAIVDEQSGRPVKDVLLRAVKPRGAGTWECTVMRALATPRTPGPGSGFRCMKLGAESAPVRVKFIGANRSLSVRVHEDSFEQRDRMEPIPQRVDGIFESAKALPNGACVLVEVGTREVDRFPVALVNDEPFVREVQIDAKVAAADEIEEKGRRSLDILVQKRRGQEETRRQIARLLESGNAEDARKALEIIDRDTKTLQRDLPDLRARLDDLATSITLANATPFSKSLAATCEVQWRTLNEQNESLLAYRTDLAETVRQAADPLLARARQAFEAGDYDGALALYDEFLTKNMNPSVQKIRDDLRARWEIKDDAHRKAREYLLGTWVKTNLVQNMSARMPKAQDAVKKCKAVNDRLTLLKTFRESTELVEKLQTAAEKLKNPGSLAERKDLELVQDVAKELTEFLRDLEQFLRGEKTP